MSQHDNRLKYHSTAAESNAGLRETGWVQIRLLKSNAPIFCFRNYHLRFDHNHLNQMHQSILVHRRYEMKFFMAFVLLGVCLINGGLVDAAVVSKPSSTAYSIFIPYINPICAYKRSSPLRVIQQGVNTGPECEVMLDYVDHGGRDGRSFDFIPACPDDTYYNPWWVGEHNNTKFIFYTDPTQIIVAGKTGVQILGGRMVIEHPEQGVLVDRLMHVGMTVGQEQQSWTNIYCP